jgi:CO/xanthine dehydrogenase Mo-binding subunit
MSQNILAADKVLYKEHAVAAVAATGRHIAEEALARIDVEYDVLPVVLNEREAMQEDAPILHKRLMPLENPHIRPSGLRDDNDPGQGSNLANQFMFEVGDVAQGFREADVIVEREYCTAPVHQGYIEPHCATAYWNTDGNLTIWSSSQGHFAVRDQTAMVLGIPVSRVKVIPMEIGGGFGSKTLIYLEPVAGGYWHNSTGPASAIISVNADGTVNLVEGSMDVGGSRATAAMHIAEVLGIAYEAVRPSVDDTDAIGFTSTTGGSSATFKTGWACYQAAHDVKGQMIERAAKLWEITPDDVEYTKGSLVDRRNPEQSMTFKELARRLNATGGPIVGRANLAPRGVSPGFGFHIVDVEVDPETGKTQILQYTTSQDVGKAIHPSYVEGQIQGGAVQGIGWVLNEEYLFNAKGVMLNASFLDYRMPTSLDLPMIEAVLVEVANPGHPFGLRGVGEVPIVPPMAAVANAIYHAAGVRMRQLPMSPSKVLEALWAKQSNGHQNNGNQSNGGSPHVAASIGRK